jgi:hypothetical protein
MIVGHCMLQRALSSADSQAHEKEDALRTAHTTAVGKSSIALREWFRLQPASENLKSGIALRV